MLGLSLRMSKNESYPPPTPLGLVGPVFSSRGTTELSVYPCVCVCQAAHGLLSRYMVADHLANGSFDLLPQVIH